MKKNVLLLAAAFLLQQAATAQYYYQDIHNTLQTEANMALLKENKVSVQLVQSLDANQDTDNDFRCQRILGQGYRQMRSIMQSRATGLSVMTSTFSGRGKLTKTVDSTESSISTVQYRYDEAGRLLSIQSVSQARDSKFKISESRYYAYDSLGRPLRMVRRKGDSGDSSVVTFKTDGKGRVTEEQESGRNMRSQRVYYKYDEQGRLTDVVRYSPARKRLLPDYMFEYDAQGRLLQMTTVNAETADYTIWKYFYTPAGLPDKEECYGKGRQLLGMVRYRYTQ